MSLNYLAILPIELRAELCNYLSLDPFILTILLENITQFKQLQQNDKLWSSIYHHNLSEVIRSSVNAHETYLGNHSIYQLYILRMHALHDAIMKYSNTSMLQYLKSFFIDTANVNEKLLRFITKRDYEKVFEKYWKKSNLEFTIKNCKRAARYGAFEIFKMLSATVPVQDLNAVEIFRSVACGFLSYRDFIASPMTEYPVNYEFAKYLVEKYSIDVRQNNNEAFNWASQYGFILLFEYYLSLGVDPRYDNDRALEFACNTGKSLPIIQQLIELGCDPFANDQAIFIGACDNELDNVEIVKYLVSLGGNIHDSRALDHATTRGKINIVKWLVDQGVDVTMNNNVAFRNAVKFNRLEIVKYFISLGVHLRLVNPEENLTVFDINRDMIKLLDDNNIKYKLEEVNDNSFDSSSSAEV